MVKFKRSSYLILLVLCVLALSGCSNLFGNIDTEEYYLTSDADAITLNVGDEIQLTSIWKNQRVYWQVGDQAVAAFAGTNIITAVAPGSTTLNAYYSTSDEVAKSASLIVYYQPEAITVSGKQTLKVGDTIALSATVTPAFSDVEYVWTADNDIISVSSTGVVEGLKVGLSQVSVSVADCSYCLATYDILVVAEGSETSQNLITNETTTNEQDIVLSDQSNIFEPAIHIAQSYTIGISNYQTSYSGLTLAQIGSAIVYKREGIRSNGDVVANITVDDENITNYRYYFVTSKQIINNATYLSVYLDGGTEVEAHLIQKDDATDLAVGYFTCPYYLAVASFADSDLVVAGSLCVSVGTADSYDYFNTPAKGIVSFVNRYLAEDTDGDEVNDTDTCYIQHSAALSTESAGGPVVNLNGEVIGMNSYNMTDSSAENMGFAIASNTLIQIIEILETGEIPVRPKLLITIMSVKDLIKNDGYLAEYYGYTIPDGLTYGMYITEVTAGGVASAAGVQPGDVLIEFNGVAIQFSYQMRSELYKFVVDSGMETTLKVYRDGVLLTLDVIF